MLEVGGIQTDGVPQTGAQRPAQLQGLEGENQPGNTHQGDDGEAHIGSDGHFLALQAVQHQSIQVTADGGDNAAHHDGEQEAEPAGDTQLDGQQAADQAGHQTDGKTQVQADAALNTGHHGQNHDGVHAHTHHSVAEQGGQRQVIPQCHEAQQDEEDADDNTGDAQLGYQNLIEHDEGCGNQKGQSGVDQIIGVAEEVATHRGFGAQLFQIPVILGIEAVAGLVYDGINGFLQGCQSIIIQNGINHLQGFAHADVGTVHNGLGIQHFLGGNKAAHVHLNGFVLGDILTGGQQSLPLGFHFGLGFLVVGIDVGLSCGLFQSTMLFQSSGVIVNGSQKLGGSHHALGELGVLILGTGVFLGLLDGIPDGGHSAAFGLCLSLSLFLGNVHIALHHAVAGGVEQGTHTKIPKNGIAGGVVLFGKIHSAKHQKHNTGKAQQGSNDSSGFVRRHTA